MKKIKILVTGAGGGIGQGIIKAARMITDCDIHILAADMSARAAGLYMADEHFIVPAFFDAHYKEMLLGLLRDHKVDHYFPGTDVELPWCAEHADEIRRETGTNVVVSNIHAITIANDKWLTAEFFRERAMPYPHSWLECTDYQGAYPVIVKPRIGCRSIGVHVAHSATEMRTLCAQTHNYIVQDYCGTPQEEYTCTIVKCKGQLSSCAILQRELRAGDTYKARPIENTVIAEFVTTIAKELDIEGACNVQLRLDNGVPKCFEINCRFSGTTPFCASLGFNPVEFYLKTFYEIPFDGKLDLKKEIVRYWQEMVIDRVT